jgi:CBS domain containing-hemolysin-like protein
LPREPPEGTRVGRDERQLRGGLLGRDGRDGRVSLEDFKERTGIDLGLALEKTDAEVDTLGGVVFEALGRVPVRGEIITQGGFEFEILEADPRRVKRLRIRALPPMRVEVSG